MLWSAPQIMRTIIVGTGAISGSLAAELSFYGAELVVVAPGAHGVRIAEAGLHYRTPTEDRHVAMRVLPSIEALQREAHDVVILATKLGDTEDAAKAIAQIDNQLPTLCLQNGVAGEDMAARHLERVYGGMVYLPATYLEVGCVDNYCSNGPGALRMGPFRGGILPLLEELATVLAAAGFQATSVDEIMPWKTGKLLTNLGSALEVACSDWKNAGELYARTLAEGEACLQAAAIDYLEVDKLVAALSLEIGEIAGQARSGGSMWQSVARGRDSEVQYLNGFIVNLAQAHGVPTPINQMLVRAATRTFLDGTRWSVEELAALAKAL